MKPTQNMIDTLHAVKSIITMLLQTDDIDKEELELSITGKIDDLKGSDDADEHNNNVLDNISADLLELLDDIRCLDDQEVEDTIEL